MYVYAYMNTSVCMKWIWTVHVRKYVYYVYANVVCVINAVFTLPREVETRLQVGKLNGVPALLKLLEPEGETLSSTSI